MQDIKDDHDKPWCPFGSYLQVCYEVFMALKYHSKGWK